MPCSWSNLNPWSNKIKGSSFINNFMHIWTYLRILNHSFIKIGSLAIEKLTSQVIWLNWVSLRHNLWCVCQMKMTPREKNVLKNHMNNFHFHQKSIWNFEGHHSFQNIIGHFDWNPNFGSTSQGPNFLNFYDFEVRPNALEILRCLIQMLCWT